MRERDTQERESYAYVEPDHGRRLIQIDETYTHKCIRQVHAPRRRRTERRKAGAGGTHNPHERTDETKRNRQRNRLEVSDACSDKQSRKVGKASGYWPISLDRKACARAYVYACRIISHHIEASGSAHGAASTTLFESGEV